MPWVQWLPLLARSGRWTRSLSIPGRWPALTWEGSLQLLQIPQNFLAQQVDEAGDDLGRWRPAVE